MIGSVINTTQYFPLVDTQILLLKAGILNFTMFGRILLVLFKVFFVFDCPSNNLLTTTIYFQNGSFFPITMFILRKMFFVKTRVYTCSH